MSADQSSTPNSELGVEKLAAALRERDDALAEVAEHWIERERLENLTDVAEHNLHEAIADLKERDAGIKRLRLQRNKARVSLARVRALAETWTEWGDISASDMLRDAIKGKTS